MVSTKRGKKQREKRITRGCYANLLYMVYFILDFPIVHRKWKGKKYGSQLFVGTLKLLPFLYQKSSKII